MPVQSGLVTVGEKLRRYKMKCSLLSGDVKMVAAPTPNA